MIQGLNLSGRVGLVTGGSRGIGRAVVELLATLGADVAVNYAHDKAAADAVVATAREKGVKAISVKADVSKLADADQMVKETLEHLGRIDFVICNAGIWEGKPVDLITEELWDKTIDINLKGTWSVCRATVPIMKRQRSGRIVIVSSTAGQRGEANVSNYAASKGGQISFTKSLAAELAEYNIHVNCVAPGWVDTDMNDGVFDDKERRESILKTIPLRRVGSADEIAGAIVFLCTDWANYMTGEVVNVNGGSVLCG